jgi:hypothetical protein
VQIVELGRQRMRNICTGVNVFCMFCVDVVAREHRSVAQVLASVPATQHVPSVDATQDTPTRIPMGRCGVAPATTSPTIW